MKFANADNITWSNRVRLRPSKRYELIFAGLMIGILLFVFGDYIWRFGDRRLCDRQCNHGQCSCVETCPHEREMVSDHDLDPLVNDLNRTISAGRFVGNTVVYEREEWDRINNDITKIIAHCITVHREPQAKRKS